MPGPHRTCLRPHPPCTKARQYGPNAGQIKRRTGVNRRKDSYNDPFVGFAAGPRGDERHFGRHQADHHDESRNELLWPLITIGDADKMPVSVAALSFRGEHQVDYGALFAAYVSVSIPLVLIFVVVVRKFIRGIEGI